MNAGNVEVNSPFHVHLQLLKISCSSINEEKKIIDHAKRGAYAPFAPQLKSQLVVRN